jgi:tellurite resistance protein TerA
MPIDYTKPSKPATAPAAPPPQAAPAPPAAGSAPVSLGKVTLTKSAPTVSLSKQGSTGGMLRVNLNWTARPVDTTKPEEKKGGGFLKRIQNAAATAAGGSGAIDLDLAAMYEFMDGSKGVVQALGNTFQDRHSPPNTPVLRLDGDDRSGTNTGGENLFVDLSQASRIKRILVFAFIYEGVPNWAGADAVVTLFPATGPQIDMRLDESDNKSRFCAIALLENDGSGLAVRREVRYIRGSQREVDQAYGWGMNWTAGSK